MVSEAKAFRRPSAATLARAARFQAPIEEKLRDVVTANIADTTFVKGCDQQGYPLDPGHPWFKGGKAR